ncbi:ubiquitin--protein ligase [Salmonella enterica subsp. enterica]|nr:ubiquitin--protein ligase [Salmonella enterica subsp. enterica serovar Poona]
MRVLPGIFSPYGAAASRDFALYENFEGGCCFVVCYTSLINNEKVR